MPRARTGKIARLSHEIREELNQRLLDNQDAGRIIAWVNKRAGLAGQGAINNGNLSEWRAGGFAEWMEKQDAIDRTRKLADYCLRMGTAGGGSMSLPAAIAGGQLMEVLEDFDPSALKRLLQDEPETWLGVVQTMAKLQKSAADEKVVAQNDVKLGISREKLALDVARFQRTTCELFLKWYGNKKAQEIAANKSAAPDVKIAELRELMFGEVEDDAA